MRKLSTYVYLISSVLLIIFSSSYIIEKKTKDQVYDSIKEIPHNEYGLVLGTSKSGKKGLNMYFKYRMDATLALYNEGKIDKIIVSGDNHIEGYNETLDMKNHLINQGIPEQDIIMDYAGFRTLDSVLRAYLVFKVTSLTIISQEFHNQRALYIANAYGIEAVAFNAKDTNRSNYTHLREYFARFLCLLDIHLFYSQPKYL